jgi:hypothetical protein
MLSGTNWSGHRESNPGLNLGKVSCYLYNHGRMKLVGVRGFEPPTLGLRVRCSTVKSYTPETGASPRNRTEMFRSSGGCLDHIGQRRTKIAGSGNRSHVRFERTRPALFPTRHRARSRFDREGKMGCPSRFELELPESQSRVLTINTMDTTKNGGALGSRTLTE